ncbi:MAG: LysR family transcriptional regulator [Phenylobacterium sp.]|nr:MAG: LysR family transcriptional regulator [Phenylobacterium sp.]
MTAAGSARQLCALVLEFRRGHGSGVPMTGESSDVLIRIPSLRSLYVFEAAARHLNLVRAAQELGLTQGALSRQIKSLEQFIGVPLFQRTPRGLKFTEAGDILWAHSQRAFAEIQNGLMFVTNARTRQSLLVAVARSYSTRVLSPLIGGFTEAYPWIDLTLDGHRHLADLSKGEADIAIRVGRGDWPDARVEKLGDDPLFPVISPRLAERLGTSQIDGDTEDVTFLHFTERNYWDAWAAAAGLPPFRPKRNIRFSETVMMLEAAEQGQGIAVARRSLVQDALRTGELVRMSDIELDDGIAYFLCYAPEKANHSTVKAFREWMMAPKPVADRATGAVPASPHAS